MTDQKSPGNYLSFFAIALLAITWFVFTTYERYLPISNELIVNQNFSNGLQGWTTGGRSSQQTLEGSTFTMRIDDPKKNQRLIQTFKNLPAGSYRVSASIRLENVIQGSENWQNAGIILATYDNKGSRTGSYDIATTSGSLPWQTVESVVYLSSISPRTDVSARMLNSPGLMQVKNISLIAVKQSQNYNLIRLCATVLWAGMGMAMLISLFRSKPSKSIVLSIVFLGLVTLLGILAPKELILSISSRIADVVPIVVSEGLSSFFRDILKMPILAEHAEYNKLGHIVIFFLLSLYARIAFAHISLTRISLILIYFILLSETLQMITNARSASLQDLFIDSVGAISGLILGQLILSIRDKS